MRPRRRKASTRWTRPEHVGAQRAPGIEPRHVHARLAGEVDDAVGSHHVEHGLERGGVVEVGLQQAQARPQARAGAPVGTGEAEELRLRVLAAEVLHEVRAHEPAHAGDEDLHGRKAWRGRDGLLPWKSSPKAYHSGAEGSSPGRPLESVRRDGDRPSRKSNGAPDRSGLGVNSLARTGSFRLGLWPRGAVEDGQGVRPEVLHHQAAPARRPLHEAEVLVEGRLERAVLLAQAPGGAVAGAPPAPRPEGPDRAASARGTPRPPPPWCPPSPPERRHHLVHALEAEDPARAARGRAPPRPRSCPTPRPPGAIGAPPGCAAAPAASGSPPRGARAAPPP